MIAEAKVEQKLTFRLGESIVNPKNFNSTVAASLFNVYRMLFFPNVLNNNVGYYLPIGVLYGSGPGGTLA